MCGEFRACARCKVVRETPHFDERVDYMHKNGHTVLMCAAARKSIRYDDIGRIDAPQICALPGVLDNISREGCKVHYPFPVVIDLDSDYEIRVMPSHISGEMHKTAFTLLCHPRWVKEDRGATEIGFSILRSPDSVYLSEYVAGLSDAADEQRVENQIVGSVCQVV